ncbi:hypothetical protein D3OALGB2SA_5765 [Olavius algarvensis associated proteobacterium Delta 3]|nr:hypothetical protein D3OALGB2SA_5765 [Olavius algarvensis associated proteobacterium Delta 3]
MIPKHTDLPEKAKLDLIPLGPLDHLAASIVAANLQVVMGLLTDIREDRPQPEHAYLERRRQYDAAKIIDTLAAEDGGAPLRLGLTGQDLCTPVLTFVYGESQLGGRAALVSMHRLVDSDPEVTYLRTTKVCIHEVGHLLGLSHCWETGCLMRFPRDLEQLDGMPLRLCSTCEYEIARHLKILYTNSI